MKRIRRTVLLGLLLVIPALLVTGCPPCCAQPPTVILCNQLGGKYRSSLTGSQYSSSPFDYIAEYPETQDKVMSEAAYCELPDKAICALTYENDANGLVCTPVERRWEPPAEATLKAISDAVNDEFVEQEPAKSDLVWLDSAVGYGQVVSYQREMCEDVDILDAAQQFQAQLSTLGFVENVDTLQVYRSLNPINGAKLTKVLTSGDQHTTCRLYADKWLKGPREDGSVQTCDGFTMVLHCASPQE